MNMLCSSTPLLHMTLAHWHGQDLTQQGKDRCQCHWHHKTNTRQNILSSIPVVLSFVVPDHSSSRALTKPDHPTWHGQLGRDNTYLTYGMGQQTPPREMGWQGEGPIAGAVANARTQGARRPREKGERPMLTLCRDSTMTTIGMMPVVA